PVHRPPDARHRRRPHRRAARGHEGALEAPDGALPRGRALAPGAHRRRQRARALREGVPGSRSAPHPLDGGRGARGEARGARAAPLPRALPRPFGHRAGPRAQPTMTDASHDPVRIGLVATSDRASQGVYRDEGIPALEQWLAGALRNPIELERRLIPDEQPVIEAALRELAVIRGKALILNLPGQPKSIRETLEGLKSPEGRTIVAGIFAAVPYCVDLIGGPYLETREEVVKAFRPKSAVRAARS